MNQNLGRLICIGALAALPLAFAVACSGGSGGGKDGDSNSSSSACQSNSDCSGGQYCDLSSALTTRSQALCPDGETEVCTDDFGDPCTPDGEEDPFCPNCACIPDGANATPNGDPGNATPNGDPGNATPNGDPGNATPNGDPGNADPGNADPGNNTAAPSGRCVTISDNGDPNGDPNATPNGDPNATPNGDPNATPNGDPNATPNGDPNAQPNAMTCDDDPLTASGVFRGETDFGECDQTTPTNCRSTYWIVSDAGCFCTWPCGDLGLNPGDACDTNGVITCQATPNDGNWCLHPDMGVCTL